MKKVVYNVTRYKRDEIYKISGIACISKNGKPYIRVFEDCVKECHQIVGRDKEYKVEYSEIREVEFEVKGAYETREIELEYRIWYKLAD